MCLIHSLLAFVTVSAKKLLSALLHVSHYTLSSISSSIQGLRWVLSRVMNFLLNNFTSDYKSGLINLNIPTLMMS